MSDSKPLLIYFDGRGRGETTRLMLAAAGVEFDERCVGTRDQLIKLIEDGKLMFGQIPYLKWGDQEMVQSGAIVRYIAKKSGMMGDDLDEETRIDQLYQGTADFLSKFIVVGFMYSIAEIKEEAKKTILPKYMPIFDKILSNSTSGFLVGEKFSLADGGLLEALLMVEEFCGDEAFQDYENVKRFLVTVNELPNIQNYRRNVRKPPSSPDYVNTVNAVLNRPSNPKF